LSFVRSAVIEALPGLSDATAGRRIANIDQATPSVFGDPNPGHHHALKDRRILLYPLAVVDVF
jgi:hypothetical protein